ncbi:MAG: metallophosphoesterase [Clostridia bacterium]|nr:metallophosphoesterase [Clostridia bacterium]
MKNKIKFSVFSDFHYKFGMYIASVENFNTIMEKAKNNNVDFVIHGGDFCNDYIGSPELINTYMASDQKVYGIYGNHELESNDNSMAFVTPKLTNDNNVIWGTESKTIEDGTKAYYYFDFNGFRMIFTDTNYSYNEGKKLWEHNYTCSYGPPKGNIKFNSLGPEQLKWLETVVFDAADKGLHCIIVSHDSFSNFWGSSADTDSVREIFSKANTMKKGTVLMAINGHHHTNRLAKVDNIVFLNVNCAVNGRWIPEGYDHYTLEQTYLRSEYDENGVLIECKQVPLSQAWMSRNTWYFAEPLSAIITVESDGHIIIDGMKTKWLYDVDPNDPNRVPEITSCDFLPQ